MQHCAPVMLEIEDKDHELLSCFSIGKCLEDIHRRGKTRNMVFNFLIYDV
jgi:hypothetical protein